MARWGPRAPRAVAPQLSELGVNMWYITTLYSLQGPRFDARSTNRSSKATRRSRPERRTHGAQRASHSLRIRVRTCAHKPSRAPAPSALHVPSLCCHCRCPRRSSSRQGEGQRKHPAAQAGPNMSMCEQMMARGSGNGRSPCTDRVPAPYASSFRLCTRCLPSSSPSAGVL